MRGSRRRAQGEQVPAAKVLRADPASRRPYAVEVRVLAGADAETAEVGVVVRRRQGCSGLFSTSGVRVRIRNEVRRIDSP